MTAGDSWEASGDAQLRDWRGFVGQALREIRASPPLAWTMFRANLRGQRRRTLLGNLWLILPAGVAAAGASYIQSHGIVAIRPIGMPYPVFVFAGALFWQVFLESLNAPIKQLGGNRALITRLRFPHEGLILAGMGDVLVNAAARIAALLLLCLVIGCPLAPSALLLPVGVVGLAILGLAIGLFLAPLALLYDDVGRGLLLVTNALVFLMPVAYPIRAEGLQRFNIVLPLLDTTRGFLVGTPPTHGYGPGLLFGALLLLLAWPFYRLAKPHVMARLG